MKEERKEDQPMILVQFDQYFDICHIRDQY